MVAFPFELVTAPATLPHACVCRGSRGPFVQTRIEAPLGDVYLCADCVRAIVGLYQLVPAADHQAVQEQLADANARVAELSAELENANGRLATLEPELTAAYGELQMFRDERGAVNAELLRVGRECEQLRAGAPVADLREAVAAIGAAAVGPRKRSRKVVVES
jgi:hypothetical protein